MSPTPVILARCRLWPTRPSNGTADGPNAFYAPLAEYNRIEGDFSDEAKSTSLYTWLELHPGTVTLVGTIALGALAALARRSLGDGKNGAGQRHSLSEQQAAIPEELAVLG